MTIIQNNWIDNTALLGYALTSTLTSDFLSSVQTATSYYNKTEIDGNNWIDATALTPYETITTLTANSQTNSQLASNYFNEIEIDANSWIDATALTPYVLTFSLTNGYLISAKIIESYYNKTEVDGLIAGGGGGDVSNPIDLVDINTTIERYVNSVFIITLDLTINETSSGIRLFNGTNYDTDLNTYLECNNTTNGIVFRKQVFLESTTIFNNDTVLLPVSTNGI